MHAAEQELTSLSLVGDSNAQASFTYATKMEEPLRSLKLRKDKSKNNGYLISLESLEAVSNHFTSSNKHGLPTCLSIHSKFISIGTSRAMILLFDHFQNLRHILTDPFSSTSNGNTSSSYTQSDMLSIEQQRVSVNSIDSSTHKGLGDNILVAGYSNGKVVLWDMARATSLRIVPDAHTHPLAFVLFSTPQNLNQPTTSSLQMLSTSQVSQNMSAITVDVVGNVNIINFNKVFMMPIVTHEKQSLLDSSTGRILALSVCFSEFALSYESNRTPSPPALSAASTPPMPASSSSSSGWIPGVLASAASAAAATVSSTLTSTPILAGSQSSTSSSTTTTTTTPKFPILLALSNSFNTLIISLETPLKVLYKWKKDQASQDSSSSGSTNSAASKDTSSSKINPITESESLCLSWGQAAPKGGGNKSDQFIPLRVPTLARGWQNRLELIQFFPTSFGGFSSIPKFIANIKTSDNSSIISVEWLNDRFLAFMESNYMMRVFDTHSMVIVESTNLTSIQLVWTEFPEMPSANPSLPLNETTTYQNTITAHHDRLYLLGSDEIKIIRVQSWSERVDNLIKESAWLDALALAAEFYETSMKPFELQRRRMDPSNFRSQVSEGVFIIHTADANRMAEMIVTFVKRAFSSSSLELPSLLGEDGGGAQDVIKTTIATSIEYCTTIDRQDILFSDIYDILSKQNYSSLFLELLAPYVFNKKVTRISPMVLRDLVALFVSQKRIKELERLILNLDPSPNPGSYVQVDLDGLIKLCKANKLLVALVYLYNFGLGDYTTPIQVLLDEELLIAQNAVSAKGANPNFIITNESQTSNSMQRYRDDIGYKLLLYLRYSFLGIGFPTGQIPEGLQSFVRSEILKLMFCRKVAHYNASNNTTFPRLHLLLEFDSKATLESIGTAFDIPGLTFDPNSTPTSLLGDVDYFKTLDDALPAPSAMLHALVVAASPELEKIFLADSINEEILDRLDILAETANSVRSILGSALNFVADRIITGYIAAKQVLRPLLELLLRYHLNQASERAGTSEKRFSSQQAIQSNSNNVEYPENRIYKPPTDLDPEQILVDVVSKCSRSDFDFDLFTIQVQTKKLHRVNAFISREMLRMIISESQSQYSQDAPELLERVEQEIVDAYARVIEAYVLSVQTGHDEVDHQDKFCFLVYDFIQEQMDHPLEMARNALTKAVLIEALPLAKLDPNRFADHIVKILAPHTKEVIEEKLQGESKLQFVYLRSLINDPEFQHDDTILSMDIIQLFIKYLCEFEPDKVYDWISSNDGIYPLDSTLTTCRKYRIDDAVAYLLERAGDVVGALDLILLSLSARLEALRSALERRNLARADTNSSGMDDSSFYSPSKSLTCELESKSNEDIYSLPETRRVQSSLEVAIQLCIRNSSIFRDDEEAEDLWFRVLEKFSSQQDYHDFQSTASSVQLSLKSFLESSAKEIIENMVSYVRVQRVLNKITQDYKNESFGRFKHIILGVIESYSMESKIMDIALRSAQSDQILLWKTKIMGDVRGLPSTHLSSPRFTDHKKASITFKYAIDASDDLDNDIQSLIPSSSKDAIHDMDEMEATKLLISSVHDIQHQMPSVSGTELSSMFQHLMRNEIEEALISSCNYGLEIAIEECDPDIEIESIAPSLRFNY